METFVDTACKRKIPAPVSESRAWFPNVGTLFNRHLPGVGSPPSQIDFRLSCRDFGRMLGKLRSVPADVIPRSLRSHKNVHVDIDARIAVYGT